MQIGTMDEFIVVLTALKKAWDYAPNTAGCLKARCTITDRLDEIDKHFSDLDWCKEAMVACCG